MHKVIVERERVGSDSRYRPRRQKEKDIRLEIDAEGLVDVSHLSRCVSSQPGRGDKKVWRKYLNENLNPLRRWLLKQVGRKWDNVSRRGRELSLESTSLGSNQIGSAPARDSVPHVSSSATV